MKHRYLAITLLHAVSPLALLTFTLFGAADVQAQTCTPAPAGLVSWWPLDETSGTAAADIVDGNPGTHLNGPTPTPGMVAGGLSFDGVDDYVRIPDTANLNPGTSNFSVDFWMKTSSQPTGSVGDNIISKRPICNVGSFWDIRLRGSGRVLVELLEQAGPNNVGLGSTSMVNDGQWRHIAVVRVEDWEGSPGCSVIVPRSKRSRSRTCSLRLPRKLPPATGARHATSDLPRYQRAGAIAGRRR